MRLDTNTSPVTPGAGRRYSFTWGLWGQPSLLSDPNQANTITQRPGGITSQSYWTTTVTGAPPTPRGSIAYAGRLAWAMTSDAATGYVTGPSFITIDRPFVMAFQEVKGPANLSNIDDFACWSVSAILAYDAIPGAITGDLGLTLGTGTRSNIRGASQFAGIEVGPSNTGVMSVFIRQTDGGAVTYNQPTVTQPDQTQWNRYEIRIVGPTSSAEAQIKVFINNVLQVALPYGAGSLLPSQILGGTGNLGMVPALINFKANAATTRMYASILNVCAAPTEAMLSGTTAQ